jgi:hypothetical protein
MKTLRGTIHGKTIELEVAPNLPSGQEVDVTIKPVSEAQLAGEGLQQAFGAWAEDPEDLDDIIDWNRQQRKVNRPEIEG